MPTVILRPRNLRECDWFWNLVEGMSDTTWIRGKLLRGHLVCIWQAMLQIFVQFAANVKAAFVVLTVRSVLQGSINYVSMFTMRKCPARNLDEEDLGQRVLYQQHKNAIT